MYLMFSGSLVLNGPTDIYSIATLFPHSFEAQKTPKVNRVKFRGSNKKIERTTYLNTGHKFISWLQSTRTAKLQWVDDRAPAPA